MRPATSTRSVRSGRATKFTRFIKPMLATLHNEPFDDDDWLFEIKWDGYRAIAESGPPVKLYSRNGLSFASLYPAVVGEVGILPPGLILDGEIVAPDRQGRPEFQRLQQYRQGQPLVYYVFDCLRAHGRSITHLPLTERKEIVREILASAGTNIIRFSDHVTGAGKAFFREAGKKNLEGIVAKRAASRYAPGRRTTEWLKVKHQNTQEAIIAGYTSPRGSREHFGALVLGILDDGKLRYIGHTGTGFTQKTLRELHQKMKPLRRKTSPFKEKIPVSAGVTWVEPVLVCQIRYSEITKGGILRHPVYLGLRLDKPAKEVTDMDVSHQEKPPVK